MQPNHSCATAFPFKLGIVHFMAFPQCLKGEGPILESLQIILKDPLFQTVEVGWIKDRDVMRQARSMAETAGVEVLSAAQPRLLVQNLDLNYPEQGARMSAVEEMKRAMDDARQVGSSSLAFLSGAWPGPDEASGAWDRLCDSIQRMSSHDPDLRLVLETFDRHVDKKRLVGPSREAAEFCLRVRREVPSFGLLVDLSHLPLLNETSSESLAALKGLLAHVHVGNAFTGDPSDPAWGDQHPRFGYPGSFNGHDELAGFLVELARTGYFQPDGGGLPTLSYEVKPTGAEDSALLIAGTHRTLAKAWHAARSSLQSAK